MSYRRCAVYGCVRTTSLHMLPKDPDVREKWIQFIVKKSSTQINAHLRVCSSHFTSGCFENKSQYDAGFAQKLLLKDRAVPTIWDPTRIKQTNVQQLPAVVDLHFDETNQTTENDVGDATNYNSKGLVFCDQDSVASSLDFMFTGGLDPLQDWPSSEIDSPEDNEASLHKRKRPSLSSTSALPEKGAWRNRQDCVSFKTWQSGVKSDDEPSHPVFTPVQEPGPKFISNSCNNPLKFFQLFFSKPIMQEIVTNTNIYGTKCQKTGKRWEKITRKELDSFIALVIFMGLFKCSSLADYWRDSKYFGLMFPGRIMSYQRFLSISNALHISDITEDEENSKKKGTPDYERLGKIQPLYQIIREACKTYYHPFQNITIDERMVTSEARTGLRKCIMDKPSNNGYKLFALSDCTSHYTWDFFVYEGKSCASQSQGLSYESVMTLVDENMLGTGYKLFVDQFYTSPTLFRDLLHKSIWACGPFWANRKGFPRPTVNGLPKNAPQGTTRWIKDKELLFVRWKDEQEVQMCSTFHKAYEGDTVKRKVKRGDGTWISADIPIPAPVLDYERNMEALDPSNCITGHFRLLHKPREWYQSVFYHALDIAIENAFILQEMTPKAKNKRASTRTAFLEMLILKLIAGVPVPSARPSAANSTAKTPATSAPSSPASSSFHNPKHITQDSSAGGRKCELCQQETTVMCVTCDVMLCFQPQRDCYNDWHDKQGL
ncbi:piggyBac transposable element-derived protein 4-like [Triplophysa dalaica]|uniref:piggyBac transposable element-derived protein 4-like n=1 Tax=Triplophysa dalaica TaxID=1582913 RepID=UPI0024DF57FD|nr:piggyBac transposable element-derived protein 4-like [Triplophysa dalaica]